MPLSPTPPTPGSEVPENGASIEIITSIREEIVEGISYSLDRESGCRLPETSCVGGKCEELPGGRLDCAGIARRPRAFWVDGST